MDKIDELTAEQLDRLTAEHVMGLDMDSIDNYMVFEGETWRPTLNGNQALELLKKVCLKKPFAFLCFVSGSVHVGWHIMEKSQFGYDEILGEDISVGAAICRAALKAVGYDPD